MTKFALLFSASCVFFLTAQGIHAQDIAYQHGLAIYGKLQTQPISCTVLMSKYVIQLHHDDESLPEQDDEHLSGRKDDLIYIQLGGDTCDANEGYKNIGLKFLGPVDDVIGNVLANTASGSNAAQGVGIKLADWRYNTIIPNSTVSLFPSATSGKSTDLAATFPLNLVLVKLKGQAATPGNIQANMTVQIERL